MSKKDLDKDEIKYIIANEPADINFNDIILKKLEEEDEAINKAFEEFCNQDDFDRITPPFSDYYYNEEEKDFFPLEDCRSEYGGCFFVEKTFEERIAERESQFNQYDCYEDDFAEDEQLLFYEKQMEKLFEEKRYQDYLVESYYNDLGLNNFENEDSSDFKEEYSFLEFNKDYLIKDSFNEFLESHKEDIIFEERYMLN